MFSRTEYTSLADPNAHRRRETPPAPRHWQGIRACIQSAEYSPEAKGTIIVIDRFISALLLLPPGKIPYPWLLQGKRLESRLKGIRKHLRVELISVPLPTISKQENSTQRDIQQPAKVLQLPPPRCPFVSRLLLVLLLRRRLSASAPSFLKPERRRISFVKSDNIPIAPILIEPHTREPMTRHPTFGSTFLSRLTCLFCLKFLS